MKIKFKKIVSLFASFFLVSMGFAPSSNAQTAFWGGVCVGQGSTSDGVSRTDVATLQGLQCMMANILSIFLTAMGIAGFIMIIIASFRWMLSGGKAQEVEKAGKTIVFVVAGLLLALSSFIILNLLAEFTGIKTILNFVIPSSQTVWPNNTP